MSFILTLVNTHKKLGIHHLEQVYGFIDDARIGVVGKPMWLDPHCAADIPVQNCLTLTQMQKLRAVLAKDKIDIFCTPAQGRQKKLLLADMDATMVTGETLDDLAAALGLGEKISDITAAAMAGTLDFKAALKERVALLKGLDSRAIDDVLGHISYEPGAKDLVSTMRANGAFCVLVSGGFTTFTQKTADDLGFDAHHGNVLGVANGQMDGTVKEPILDKSAKEVFLKTYAKEHQLSLSQTMAIGDGANDLPMLLAAGLGIGYRPKPILEETLPNVLIHSDHRAALYVQGYKNLIP